MDDRAEAIDILTRMSTNHFYGHREQEAFKLAVEALGQRWIPVTERLPEEEGQYLVSGKCANKDEEIWICEFVLLCHIRGWCDEVSRPVIQAWMPLPSPYKEGEAE